MPLESIMEAIVGAVVGFKKAFIGDVGWGVFFLLLVAMSGGLRWLYVKWTKQYDVDVVKAKWFGLGRIMHGIYAGRNWFLKAGTIAATFFMLASMVVAGASKNGTVADANSALTSLPTGCYYVTTLCEQMGDSTVVYMKKVLDAESGIKTERLGRALLIESELASSNTSFRPGAYLSINLFEGHTFVSELNEAQVQKIVNEHNNRWWVWLGKKLGVLLS